MSVITCKTCGNEIDIEPNWKKIHLSFCYGLPINEPKYPEDNEHVPPIVFTLSIVDADGEQTKECKQEQNIHVTTREHLDEIWQETSKYV